MVIIIPQISYYVINHALNGGKTMDILNKVKRYREEEEQAKMGRYICGIFSYCEGKTRSCPNGTFTCIQYD